jgi:hypothetical protein
MIGYKCDACANHFAVPMKALHCPRCGGKQLTVLSAPGVTPVAGPVYAQVAEPVGGPLAYASPASLPPVPKRSFAPYAMCFWGAVVAGVIGILSLIASTDARGDTEDVLIGAGILFLVAAWAMWLAATIFGLIILYRGWSLVQPLRYNDPRDAQMPTPGKAIGFLFIPFFNLYWVFVAVPGLAEKLNRLAQQRGVVPRVSHGLAMTHAVLFVCGIVPYIGLLPLFVGMLFLFFVLKGVHASIDAMA